MIKLIKSTFYKEKETKKELCSFITNATQLSFGQECQKFEERFATHQKRKYCIFFNSGSSANFALIQALFNLKILKQSDKAAFSAVTWSTNPMPLIQLGLNIIPVDVELETLNVSSRTLVDVIDRNPLKVFFLTNLLGFCDDIDKIANICKERKIVLIEDNCEALGSVYKNKKLGNFGLASTFSFYVGHHMSTVEGGAVCTDNESLAIMLKLVRAHGWDRDLSDIKKDKLKSLSFRERRKAKSRLIEEYNNNLQKAKINLTKELQAKLHDEFDKKIKAQVSLEKKKFENNLKALQNKYENRERVLQLHEKSLLEKEKENALNLASEKKKLMDKFNFMAGQENSKFKNERIRIQKEAVAKAHQQMVDELKTREERLKSNLEREFKVKLKEHDEQQKANLDKRKAELIEELKKKASALLS